MVPPKKLTVPGQLNDMIHQDIFGLDENDKGNLSDDDFDELTKRNSHLSKEEFKIDYDVYVETHQSPLNPDEALKHANSVDSNQEDDKPKILLQEKEVTGKTPEKLTPKSVLDEKDDYSSEKKDNQTNDDDDNLSDIGGIKLDDLENLSLASGSVAFAEIADNNIDDLLRQTDDLINNKDDDNLLDSDDDDDDDEELLDNQKYL